MTVLPRLQHALFACKYFSNHYNLLIHSSSSSLKFICPDEEPGRIVAIEFEGAGLWLMTLFKEQYNIDSIYSKFELFADWAYLGYGIPHKPHGLPLDQRPQVARLHGQRIGRPCRTSLRILHEELEQAFTSLLWACWVHSPFPPATQAPTAVNSCFTCC